MKLENRHEKINEFFNSEYDWWENVYNKGFPKGFFSFEMIRRKEIILEMLKEMIREKVPTAILECGCGPGGILKEIDPINKFLVGVDINFRYIANARENCNSMDKLLQADIERLPFKNDSFDIAYCIGVLSYLEDDRKAIKDICRVIKPGGKIIISGANRWGINKIIDPYYYTIWMIRKIWKKLRNYSCSGEVFKNKFNIEMARKYRYKKLNRLYQEFGLKKVQTVGVSFGPLTIWHKRVLPLSYAIRISQTLAKLSNRRGLGFLIRLANHWVTWLEKTTVLDERGI